MRPHPSSEARAATCLAAAWAVLSSVTPALAAPGDLDTDFAPTFDSTVHTAVSQWDGKILLGGTFTKINGGSAFYRKAGRVNADGTTDTTYNPDFNAAGIVYSINAGFSGDAFMTGSFSHVKASTSPTVRQNIALFNNNSAVYTSFVPAVSAPTYSIREQAGSLYIVGTSRGVARLTAAGGVESSFTRYESSAGAEVLTAQVLSDSRVLMNGSFVYNNTEVDEIYFDRLSTTGAKDPSFHPPILNGPVYGCTVLPSGALLVCGSFGTAQQTVTPVTTYEQPYLIKLSTNGVVDPAFRPLITGGQVHCMAVQADGKILIGGAFTSISSTTGTVTTTLTRRGIARLTADGKVDPTFDAKITSPAYTVKGISLQGDGRPIITGDFQQFNGNVSRSIIARLQNDEPSSKVYATSTTNVRWMRGASAPEAQAVRFEYSTNGTTWSPIGTGIGTRITGGWQVNATTDLPATCTLRAKAQISGGVYGSSLGVVSATGEYPLPIMELLQPPSTIAPPASVVDLGVVTQGGFLDATLSILNTGTGALTGLTTTLTGAQAPQFTLLVNPTSPVAGPEGSTNFVLRFTPTGGLGERTVDLTLNATNANVPSFTVQLKARSVTALEAWRYQYFGNTESTGTGSDAADPDGDGHNNLFEYIAGLSPVNPTSRFNLNINMVSGQPRIVFSPRLSVRTYTVEYNSGLNSDGWTTATGSTTDAGSTRTFTHTLPMDTKRFYRVKIVR